MHELSIALHLVERAEEATAAAGGGAIEVVRIRVGDASGVVAEALEFAWTAAREGTACAGARLEIERVPVRVRCEACADEPAIAGPLRLRCPRCGGAVTCVVAGRELELVALEVSDDAPTEQESPNAPAHP